MLQKTDEPRPQPQGVIARLGEHAGRRGGLSRYLNLLSDFLQQRRRVFLPQLMACRLVQLLFPRERVDGKQFLDQGHNRDRCRIAGIDLNRVLKLSNRMSPARSMHHTIGAHTIVRRVTVGLQDAVEGCERLWKAIPSAPKAEVEDHRSDWTRVLLKVALMVV